MVSPRAAQEDPPDSGVASLTPTDAKDRLDYNFRRALPPSRTNRPRGHTARGLIHGPAHSTGSHITDSLLYLKVDHGRDFRKAHCSRAKAAATAVL
jgi:hypothetical protein